MSDQIAQLSAAIKALPPTVNPYTFVFELLHEAMAPQVGKNFVYFIDIYFGLGACALFFGIVALICKVVTGSAWLFRRKVVDKGTLILPNTGFLLALFAVFWAAILIVDGHFLLSAYRHSQSPVAVQGLQGVTWLPMLMMGWTSAMGMCVSSYLSRHNRSRKARFSTFNQLADKVRPSRLPTIFINAFFLSGYLVQAVVILPMFGKATVDLRKAWNTLMDIKSALQVPASSWQPGDAFVLQPAWLPAVDKLNSQGATAIDSISHGFKAYVVIMGCILLVFLPSAIVYIKMLSTQIRDYIDSLATSADGQNFVRIHQLKGTYRLMILESIIVFTVGIILIGEAAWMGSDKHVLVDSRKLTIVWAICLFTAGLLIAPLNFILALRSIRPLWIARNQKRSNNRHLMSAIQVTAVMERFIEGEDIQEKQVILQDTPGKPALVSFSGVKEDFESQKSPYSI